MVGTRGARARSLRPALNAPRGAHVMAAMEWQWIAPVTIVAVVVGIIVFAIRWESGRAIAFREAWSSYALSRGLAYAAASGPWYRRQAAAIEGDVEGVPIRLDTYVVSTGHAHVTYTRVQSRLPRPVHARVCVTPRTVFTGLGERLGRETIRTSDPTFDRAMAVRSKSRETALGAVDDAVRSRTLGIGRKVSMQVEGENLKIWWQGGESSPEILDAASRLAAALARSCARSS